MVEVCGRIYEENVLESLMNSGTSKNHKDTVRHVTAMIDSRSTMCQNEKTKLSRVV